LIVTLRRLSLAFPLVCCLMLIGTTLPAMPSPIDGGVGPVSLNAISGAIHLAQAQPPATSAPAPAATPAPEQPVAADAEPIGNVATLTGSATVTRNNAATPLKLQDDIFQNDVLATSANSTLGVTFNDATTFNLTANARIAIDSYVYEEGGKQNGALFDVRRGTVAFVAAAVAHTGDMRISTPTATLGIRGTTGLIEVPEGASATSANNVAVKLYPDPDGRVGRIEVNGHDGTRLGFLTQGASGFTIRPGAGGRFAAVRMMITPQEVQRDQGIVRQVHAAQSVGRQIVSQRQIQRQQNPGRGNPANPARQPGPQRQNGLPQRPGSLQQGGLPNRPGQPGQLQPNAPGLRQGGIQNRPAQQLRRPAAPKGKPPPKRKR
jgi:hypothetical protein